MKNHLQTFAILLLPLATWAQLGGIGGGATYTRWGSSKCPSTATLVYTGIAGGSFYSQGAAANYLCMPKDPEYTLTTQAGIRGHSYVYGAEYQYPLKGTHDHNVPCAVCETLTRSQILMIPAKTSCPNSGWTKEYDGYLMSNYLGFQRTLYECVDQEQESIPGSQISTDGALFHHVEANCNGMPCPPYDPQKELGCVVCSK